jgi:hypothetical protein
MSILVKVIAFDEEDQEASPGTTGATKNSSSSSSSSSFITANSSHKAKSSPIKDSNDVIEMSLVKSIRKRGRPVKSPIITASQACDDDYDTDDQTAPRSRKRKPSSSSSTVKVNHFLAEEVKESLISTDYADSVMLAI